LIPGERPDPTWVVAATADLVDHLKLLVFPLMIGESGRQPALADTPDRALELVDHRILDNRIACYDYRPAGLPPYSH